MGNGQVHSGNPPERPLIVLVEDEGTIRTLMSRILITQGFRVKPFALAHEALAFFESQEDTPDLLITDLNMPGMTGKTLADEVCKRRPGTRILFISGYTSYSPEDLDGCANPDGVFLLKPFRTEELLARVRAILGSESRPGAAS